MIRPGKRGLLLALIWLLTAALAGAGVEREVLQASYYSPSPLNPAFAGTSSFYAALKTEYRVVLGGPEDAARLAAEGVRVAYILVGPEEPVSPAEAGALVEAYNTGNLRVLVADETGLSNTLLEALGAPRIDGRVPGVGSSGGWELVASLECPWGTLYSGIVARVEGSGRTLCRAHDGSPVAVEKDRVVVVGDSTMFSNVLFDSMVSWLPGSREVALGLAREAIGDSRIIVYDNVHYSYTRRVVGLWFLPQLLVSLAETLQSQASRFLNSWTHLVVLAASLGVAGIIVTPSQPQARAKSAEETALEELLEELGVGRWRR